MKLLVTHPDLAHLPNALMRATPGTKVWRRLTTIQLVAARQSVREAAAESGVPRRTVSHRVHQFNLFGLKGQAGLKRGRPEKISSELKNKIMEQIWNGDYGDFSERGCCDYKNLAKRASVSSRKMRRFVKEMGGDEKIASEIFRRRFSRKLNAMRRITSQERKPDVPTQVKMA